mgnify:CR=1 FL=1
MGGVELQLIFDPFLTVKEEEIVAPRDHRLWRRSIRV